MVDLSVDLWVVSRADLKVGSKVYWMVEHLAVLKE